MQVEDTFMALIVVYWVRVLSMPILCDCFVIDF